MGTIYLIVLILIEALVQSYIIEKKNKDPKESSIFGIFRGLIYVGTAVGIVGPQYSLMDEWPVLIWLAFAVIARWAIFDYALNTFRGIFGKRKPWDYLGNQTFDDKIERKINSTVLLIMKTIVLAGAVTTMILWDF